MDQVNLIAPTRLANVNLSNSLNNKQASDELLVQPLPSVQHEPKEQVSAVLQESTGFQRAELTSVMKTLNIQLANSQSYLRFEKDEGTDKMVFFIKDSQTDEVLRQIPSQEFLAISKNITQYLEMAQQSPNRVSHPIGMIANEVV